MNRSTFNIMNDEEQPIFVQIDPWADLLYLINGESVTLAAYSEEDRDVIFECSKDKNTKTVYLPNNSEYFLIEGTKEINRIDYGSNIEGWSGSLHPNSSLKSRIKYNEINPNYCASKKASPEPKARTR